MLDCITSRGQFFIEQQRKTQNYLEKMGFIVIETENKDHHSDVILAWKKRNRVHITGLAEIKTREMAGKDIISIDYIKNNGGYLVTKQKITDGINLAKLLGVSFYIIVRLLSENVIIIWKLSNPSGEEIINYESKNSQTKATCNGGTTIRKNAYLSIDDASKIIYCS